MRMRRSRGLVYLAAFGLVAGVSAATGTGNAGGVRQWRVEFSRGYPWTSPAFLVNRDGTGLRRAPVPGYPTYSPDGRRIAFEIARGSSATLFVANADGSRRRAISKPDDLCFDADWSPDGKRIAYSAGCDFDFTDLYVVNRDGTRLNRLSAKSYLPWEIGPVWSPDSHTILYTAYTRAAKGWWLYLMDPEGRARRRIAGVYPQALDAIYMAKWSPDGRRIFFVSNKRLFVMQRNGKDVRDLTPSRTTIGAFGLSPDGRQIVFHGAMGGDREIYVMSADGTDLQQLTDNRVQDEDPAWSPDGASIAFVSTRDGNAEIYVMNVDGTDQRNVSNDPDDDRLPRWVLA